jgi:hypothetical protein
MRLVAVAALVLLPCLVRAQAPSDPLPIPGGLGGAHVFAPGPGLQGIVVEPNTITNFQGDVALAYVFGSGHDGTGHAFDVRTDMRVFRGAYVAADGVRREGAFGFV